MIVNNSNNLGTGSNVLNVKIDLNTIIVFIYAHKYIISLKENIYIFFSHYLFSLLSI